MINIVLVSVLKRVVWDDTDYRYENWESLSESGLILDVINEDDDDFRSAGEDSQCHQTVLPAIRCPSPFVWETEVLFFPFPSQKKNAWSVVTNSTSLLGLYPPV